jgi:DUF1680 family protein
MSAYCETCAAVANDYWNQRLFLLHGDAKYVDVLERTCTTAFSPEFPWMAKDFFIPIRWSPTDNMRAAHGSAARVAGQYHPVLASVPGYVYAQKVTPFT